MFGWFKRKGRQGEAASSAPRFSLAAVPDAFLRNEDGSASPYPDWDAIEPWVSAATAGSREDADAFWQEVQRQWLDELADALGRPYLWAESDDILLLTARPGDAARDLLGFLGRCFKATREVVGPPRTGRGKLTILCLASQDHLYDFLAPLDPEGEFGSVGGFFNSQGFFIAVPDTAQGVDENTVVHEMTHACLGDEVPVWLQEGVAQVVAERLTRSPYAPQSLAIDERRVRQHRHHWAKRGLQGFWVAASFRDADRGQKLSYELAHVLVSILAGDEPGRLRSYLHAARSDDVGASAAPTHLGTTLGELAGRFLGPGDWEPVTPDASTVTSSPDTGTGKPDSVM